MISRRSFLTRSSLAAPGASLLATPHLALSDEQLLTKAGQRPKKIIHVVSDGLSMGTLTCADLCHQSVKKTPLTWLKMIDQPGTFNGLMNTRSLNSMVTDSSAASSAWGSGSRVINGALNVLPDGRKLTTLYQLMGEKGWKTGLVTTAELTHATPAGFAASSTSRGSVEEIASQYFERKINVLLGGGRTAFAARRDKRDLAGEFAAAGYTCVTNLDELEKAPTDKRLLGYFTDGHLPYTIDHKANPKYSKIPTLAQMTKAALANLVQHENFILQVEGARIDHAAHNSDAPAAIWDQLALDEALDVILEFQKKHPDTLVVVTTDHGNSNLGLNGMGGGYQQSSQRFATLKEVKMSYPEILTMIEKRGERIKAPASPADVEDQLTSGGKPISDEDKKRFTSAVRTGTGIKVDPAAIIELIAEATGYTTSLRRATLFSKVMAGEYHALYDQMNSIVSQFGQLMANRLGMGWTGNTHTADYVPIMAKGPGAELFAGFIENTDVFQKYLSLAGIDFKNPTAPLIAHTGPEAHEVESLYV